FCIFLEGSASPDTLRSGLFSCHHHLSLLTSGRSPDTGASFFTHSVSCPLVSSVGFGGARPSPTLLAAALNRAEHPKRNWLLGLAHLVPSKASRRHPAHWLACSTGLPNRRRFFVPSGCWKSWQAAYSLLLGHALPWDHRAWLPPISFPGGRLKALRHQRACGPDYR